MKKDKDHAKKGLFLARYECAAGTGLVPQLARRMKIEHFIEDKDPSAENRQDELVRFRLEFLKPFKSVNTSEFTFRPEGDQTAVTWSMYGKNNFMAKALGLLIDCDKKVGHDFEKGLADMKVIVEA